MKKKIEFTNRQLSRLFCIVALIWYVAAFFTYLGDNTELGITHTCLGTVWLCLGVSYLKKAKDEENKK